MAFASVFFLESPPPAAAWLYLSAALAVAVFFQFARFFSVRNLDVLTLYLFAPGLMLTSAREDVWGYVWLCAASAYFLARCLADLTLVRRPALGANLNLSGLGWLAGSLFVGLIAVAAGQPEPPPRAEDRSPSDPVRELGTEAIKPYVGDVEPSRLRHWAERGLAVLCHLSVAVGLALIGWRHFDDVRSGLSCATFYLLLPYPVFLLPDSPLGVGRWDHAWPMALVVWSVFTYRRPVLAAAFLGVAAGTSPVLLCLLPVWLSFYRGRGLARFLVSFVLFASVGTAVLAGLLSLYEGNPPRLLQPAWLRFDWQPWRETRSQIPGLWKDVHNAYRAPVFLASLSFVAATGFWPGRKNLADVLALSAGALLSVQFWFADRGGSYVLWSMPLLLLMAFRPNLASSEPPVPSPDDWVARLGRGLAKRLRRRAARPDQTPAG